MELTPPSPPYEPEDEPARIFAALRAGDPGAWEAFVTRYESLVYSVPRRMGLGTEECNEVFQETWASLVDQIQAIRAPAALPAWIRTTARRQAWILLRRRSHDGSLDEVREEQTPESELPGPLPSLIDLEQQQHVREALEELERSGGTCAALLRALFQEEPRPSYGELARRLGVPEGSLGPNRGRCLARLAEILERRGWDGRGAR